MKDINLTENESIVAQLVPDEPEQLYKHKNQIAAVTNERLLFVRYTGLAKSFENSYTIESIDLRHIASAREASGLAIGGFIVGIILIVVGLLIAYLGATLKLVGPGVVVIPLISIPAGLALVFGLRRRTLIFETAEGNYRWKWVSAPLAYGKTKTIAKTVCDHFNARSPEDYNPDETLLPEELKTSAAKDYILWYHFVFLILLPYIALPWGIINLIRGKKRSGKLLCFGSIIWIIFINLLIFTIATLSGV